MISTTRFLAAGSVAAALAGSLWALGSEFVEPPVRATPGSPALLTSPEPASAGWRPPTLPLPAPRPPYGPGFGVPRVQAVDRCPPWRIGVDVPVDPELRHSFYFTRGAYSSDPFSFRGSAWATDFEKADRQFMVIVERVLPIDAFSCENPVRLDDPWLRNFPFLYMVEVGRMGLTPPEVIGLRNYLLHGGFLLVDDFWGSYEWQNFEREIRQVLPEYEIVDIPMDHLVFRIVYPVPEILQVPSIGNATSGQYWEQDGIVPHMRGIFDENGRLMVAISWNSDLGDAWEWAERPEYPWDRSNYALQMGINFLLYAMTH